MDQRERELLFGFNSLPNEWIGTSQSRIIADLLVAIQFLSLAIVGKEIPLKWWSQGIKGKVLNDRDLGFGLRVGLWLHRNKAPGGEAGRL